MNSLIFKRITSTERKAIGQIEDQEIGIRTASVHIEAGSHKLRFLNMPSTSGEDMEVIAPSSAKNIYIFMPRS